MPPFIILFVEFALDAFRGGCRALEQHLSSIYTQEHPLLGVHLGALVQTDAISPSQCFV